MTSHDPNLPLVQLQVRKKAKSGKNGAVCPSHANTPSEPKSTERPRYWRSISELKGSERFDQYLHREFPEAASELPEGVSRRRWMQLMGASFAMALSLIHI